MIRTEIEQNQAIGKTIVTVLPMLANLMRVQARDMGHNLRLSQLQLLKLVSFEPMTMSELAISLDVAKPTMTKTVNALIKREWITRRRSAADGRVYEISLAPAGEAILTQAEECLTLGLGTFLAPLSDSDKESVRAGFDILQTLLQDVQGATHHKINNLP